MFRIYRLKQQRDRQCNAKCIGGQVQEAASATVRKSHDSVRALLEIFTRMVKFPRK